MADGTAILGGIQSDGTPVDKYGQEMTYVQPEAVLELIAFTVLNPRFDATNEINYLVNQGISQEQINEQLVPKVIQHTAGAIFNKNASLGGNQGDYQKGIEFLQEQGVSNDTITSSIQNSYDSIQTQYQEGIAERNKQQGGFLGFVERALPGLALGVISGGVGSLVTGAAGTAATAASIGNSLGVTGAGATTVGAAVLGSASSSVLAAITGGDVVKSAISGAITSGTGANASDIGTFVAGGADNVTAIADALKLTEKQVTTAITNAVTSGVVSAAVTGSDVTTAITSTLASSVVGSYTTNLIANVPDLKDSATLIGNVAKVATKAIVSGTDVGDALVNSIPSIIGGLVTDPKATGEKLKEEIKAETTSTIEAGDTSDQPPGTQVLLADGTTGRVSNSGVIEPSDATSNMVTVGDKEPTGSVTLIGRDSTSITGFRDTNGNPVDSEGNRVNEDGTPYLDPNKVDVAPDNVNITPDNVNITTPTTEQELINIIKKDTADKTGTTTTTPNIVTTDPITGVKTTTGAVDTTGSVTSPTATTGGVIDTGGTTTPGGTTGTSGGLIGGVGGDIGGVGEDTGGEFRGTPTKTDTVTPSDTSDTTSPTTTTTRDQDIINLINTPTTDTTVNTITDTTTPVTRTELTSDPLTVTGTRDTEVNPLVVEGTTPERDFDYVEEEPKPYTPFEEDFPLQKDEEGFTISPTVIPKKPTKTSKSTKNARLSTGLGIDTNVGSLLGAALSTRPDVSSASEPYLLGKDEKRKDVWNVESLKGALGI
jgi:hypothetical protein